MHRMGIASAVVIFLLVSPPACAQRIIAEGIKDLAAQIATDAVKGQGRKIAVVPFRQSNGQSTILGSYISEELITDLVMIGNLKMVERSMLDKLIGELKLSQTGLIDPDTAKKLGKVAGADAIISGTITAFQTYVVINCRLIETQTGKIYAAAQTTVIKDDNLQKMMGTSLPPPLSPKN
jgi:curli biogenesis system outer membrane secretion channel CsgG